MVVQLGVCSTDRQDPEFGRKRAVVDIRRTPKVTPGRQVTELHHPGGSPDVIGLLATVVVGDVVLPEVRRHAVEESKALGSLVKLEDLDETTRRCRWEEIGRGPLHVIVRVDHREAVPLGLRVIDERRFAVVIENEARRTAR